MSKRKLAFIVDKGIVELIHSFNEIESVNVRLIILGDIDSEKLKKYFLYSVDNNCNIFYERFKKDIYEKTIYRNGNDIIFIPIFFSTGVLELFQYSG